jgi:hypothetical protein
MSVGGRLLAACCANGGLSNNQIPTCPLTTISLSFEEENRFISGDLIYQEGTATHNYPYGDQTNLIISWNAMGIGGPTGPANYNIVNTSQGNASWSVSSNSIQVVSSGGPIVRPNTNTVVALVPYKYRLYTFTKVSASGQYRNGNQAGSIISKFSSGTMCFGDELQIDFTEEITGPLVTFATTTNAPATGSISWIGACSALVTGMTLTLTVAGVAAGPWTIEVAAGQLKLKNGAGVVTTYSGLLTAVRTSINAAGFFTASITANATNAAEVIDLKTVLSNQIKTNCVYNLYIAHPGDIIAPGSRVAGNFTGVFTLSNSDSFDSSLSGLPNDQTGLSQYLSAGWYPKYTSSYSGIGTLRTVSSNYFNYNSLRWSRTSGASVATQVFTLTGNSYSDWDINILCFECVDSSIPPPPLCDFGAMGSGFADFFITGFINYGTNGTFFGGAGWMDCSFTVVQSCPPGDWPYSYFNTTQTIFPAPSVDVEGRQTLNGRLVVS